MKLLIDGYNKQTKTIAANIRFCKNLEIKVYAPEEIEIEGLDLYLLQNLIQPNKELSETPIIPNIDTIKCDQFIEKDNIVKYIGVVSEFNGSSISSTLNIEDALEWCDCYACFDSMEWDLITNNDYDQTAKNYVEKLNRIQWIKEHNKKLYLSHRLDDIFKKESEYNNMFNTVINKDSFEHMKYLAKGVLNSQSNKTDVKLVIGAYSASGKFSLCLRMKEFYETEKHERTGIIFTENISDIINSNYIENNKLDDSLIINASREWNNLSLEQYIEYIQYCVQYLELRGCKHILLQGQGSYGIHQMNRYYINKNQTMMNINNTILEHAIGCNSVAIAMCSNQLFGFFDYYNYFSITGLKITDVFVSAYDHSKEFNKEYIKVLNRNIKINSVASTVDLMTKINTIYKFNPLLNIYTDDGNNSILKDIKPFDSDEFLKFEYNDYIQEIINNLNNYKMKFESLNKSDEFDKLFTESFFTIAPLFSKNFKIEN